MEQPERPDPARMQAEIDMVARNNFDIPKAEVLGGNIGYLRINMFAPAPFAGPTFAAAMAFLKHTDDDLRPPRQRWRRSRNGGDGGELPASARHQA